MAEKKPTVNLNKAWLEGFIEDDVKPFKKDILRLEKPGSSPADSNFEVPAMVALQEENGPDATGFLTGQNKPLAIGRMVGGDSGRRTNGSNVVSVLNGLIDQLDGIIKQQIELFEEIEENLTVSLDTMFKNQGESLEKIKGAEFVEVFSDVDAILSEAPGEGGEDDD